MENHVFLDDDTNPFSPNYTGKERPAEKVQCELCLNFLEEHEMEGNKCKTCLTLIDYDC